MSITKEEKTKLIENFRINQKDTGSAEVQIAILTKKINNLSQHFKIHAKDNHSRYGFLKMVADRRKLLNYLMGKDVDKYRDVIDRLNIRR